jgi:branched-chain amino acid aminotransferase
MSLLTNLDGVIASTAVVSVLNRGFLYGDSVYEVVRTYQGVPFGVQEHLDRLRQSAAYLYLEVPWSDVQIRAEIDRTLAQTHWPESYIRIVVSRGTESTIGLHPQPDTQPSLLIIVSSIPPEPVLRAEGIHLAIVDRLRTDHRALAPAAKTGNYLNNILALLESQHQGAEDALLLNAQGQITESTISNFWIVKDGVVQTPPPSVGLLEGITRHFLLQILRDHHIPHQEVVLEVADLAGSEEAFLSSSVRLLVPIRQIDDLKLPHCPGPITQRLWQEFLQLMATHSQACSE